MKKFVKTFENWQFEMAQGEELMSLDDRTEKRKRLGWDQSEFDSDELAMMDEPGNIEMTDEEVDYEEPEESGAGSAMDPVEGLIKHLGLESEWESADPAQKSNIEAAIMSAKDAGDIDSLSQALNAGSLEELEMMLGSEPAMGMRDEESQMEEPEMMEEPLDEGNCPSCGCAKCECSQTYEARRYMRRKSLGWS